MKIDISSVLKSLGNTLNVNESEILKFEDSNLVLSGPVKVKIRLVNTGETVLVKGTVKANIKTECCRCLKECNLPVIFEIEEEYSKKAPKLKKASKDNEVELVDKDFVFPISDDNQIDLTEAIRQNLLIDSPVKPLCNKDCKGMEGFISKKKKSKSSDPRLSSLKDIKEKIRK